MAKKMKIAIPRRFLMVNKDTGTIAVRDEAGLFRGRVGPESKSTRKNPYLFAYRGVGDTTKARHLKKDTDLDRNGRIESWEKGGVIQGRTVKVKASRRARGYERRV